MGTEFIGYRPASTQEAKALTDYTVIDFETTGLSPKEDAPIQVSALRVRDNRIVDSYTSFINPYRRIPQKITELTGISNRDVDYAPDPEDVAQKLADFTGSDVLVAHNAPFDVKFLEQLYGKIDLHRDLVYCDTVKLSREAFPCMVNYKLATLNRVLHLMDADQTHRADDDTYMTYLLLRRCQDQLSGKLDQISEDEDYEPDDEPEPTYVRNAKYIPRKKSGRGRKWAAIIGLFLLLVGLSNIGSAATAASIEIIIGAALLAFWFATREDQSYGGGPPPYIDPTQERIRYNRANGIACCPHCGSTSLTANKKGYGIGKGVVGAFAAGPIGLVAGNIGRNRLRVTCLNCGYHWKM